MPASQHPSGGLLARHLFSCLLACLLLPGCAGYQLGAGSQPRFATLFIAPVKTETLIPQARELVTTQLRETFLRDGRVRLVDSAAQADAVLQVTLTGYERSAAVTRQDDTGLARRFDVTLRAHATLTDTRSRQPLFSDRPLAARRGIFTDSGLVNAEYQGLPLLAEQLAREATHAVLDTW